MVVARVRVGAYLCLNALLGFRKRGWDLGDLARIWEIWLGMERFDSDLRNLANLWVRCSRVTVGKERTDGTQTLKTTRHALFIRFSS